MDYPTPKDIGQEFRVSVDKEGSPLWTRLDGFVGSNGGNWSVILRPEQARDLLYTMQRVVAYLDDQKA